MVTVMSQILQVFIVNEKSPLTNVVSISAGVGGVTVKGQGSLASRNVDLLVIGSSLDENALGGGGGGGKGVDGSLDSSILGASCRLADDKSTGWSSGTAGGQRQADVQKNRSKVFEQHDYLFEG